MSDLSRDEVVKRIVAFLSEIGIETEFAGLPDNTFLPGIDIRGGVLFIDQDKLAYPGDLLHEAGHLALMPPERRKAISNDAGSDGGYEMAAIAWSYAAAVHLGLDLRIVFHDAGYRGGARAIIDNFGQGRYIGVPILQWLDLTFDNKTAAKQGTPAYPHMIRWTVDNGPDRP